MTGLHLSTRPHIAGGDAAAIEAAERLVGCARDNTVAAFSPIALPSSPALAEIARAALRRRRLEEAVEAAITALDALDAPDENGEVDDDGGTDLDAGESDEVEREGDGLEAGEEAGYREEDAWRDKLRHRIAGTRRRG